MKANHRLAVLIIELEELELELELEPLLYKGTAVMPVPAAA